MTHSVIIPVYNERTTILETISRVRAAPVSKEIIVVDDASDDGTPDLVSPGTLTWESVDGAPGTLVMSHGYETNLPNVPTSYYLDDATPPVAQCTGDAYALGMSGPNLATTVACTDPATGCAGYLRTLRRLVYGAPQSTTPTNPATIAQQAATPLAFTVANW